MQTRFKTKEALKEEKFNAEMIEVCKQLIQYVRGASIDQEESTDDDVNVDSDGMTRELLRAWLAGSSHRKAVVMNPVTTSLIDEEEMDAINDYLMDNLQEELSLTPVLGKRKLSPIDVVCLISDVLTTEALRILIMNRYKLSWHQAGLKLQTDKIF